MRVIACAFKGHIINTHGCVSAFLLLLSLLMANICMSILSWDKGTFSRRKSNHIKIVNASACILNCCLGPFVVVGMDPLL
jgi:hypothetical protein